MSFKNGFMDFFGLGPAGAQDDDAYYGDDDRYADEPGYRGREERDPRDARGPVAPRADRYADRRYAPREEAAYAPTVVEVSIVAMDEAKKLGEAFRDGDAVIFELTDAPKEEAKRVIDFAAGLCFGLSGRMTKLTRGIQTERQIFAVVPDGITMSDSELKRTAGLI